MSTLKYDQTADTPATPEHSLILEKFGVEWEEDKLLSSLSGFAGKFQKIGKYKKNPLKGYVINFWRIRGQDWFTKVYS